MDANPDARHHSHYNYSVSGREMTWWIHDSSLRDDRRILYVFERVG